MKAFEAASPPLMPELHAMGSTHRLDSSTAARDCKEEAGQNTGCTRARGCGRTGWTCSAAAPPIAEERAGQQEARSLAAVDTFRRDVLVVHHQCTSLLGIACEVQRPQLAHTQCQCARKAVVAVC